MVKIIVHATGSSGNLIELQSAGLPPLILEAGLPYKQIIKALKTPQDCAGFLITHEHADHAQGVKELTKHGCDCYMSYGTQRKLLLINNRCKVVTPPEAFYPGGWAVYPSEAKHDAEQPLMYSIVTGAETILFATDTAEINLNPHLYTHLIVECNWSRAGIEGCPYADRLPSTHMSLEGLISWLGRGLPNLQQLWLIHPSSSNIDLEQAADEISVCCDIEQHKIVRWWR